MTSPLLSLVLPIYNVAPYLAPCLDSLLRQTLQADQIVLVDDGSTDDSLEIMRRYAADLPGIEIVRQENLGVSAARNAGLARAKGKYVAFVDPDDFAAPELFEKLVAMAQESDLDIALGNGWYHFEGRRTDYPIYGEAAPVGVMSGETWLARMLAGKALLHMVWLHLYKREFLLRHDMAFVAGITHEDVVWTTQALMRAGRVRYDPVPRYFYRQRIRPLPSPENDRRLVQVIESTEFNARTLAGMLPPLDTGALRNGLRWQLVDGALSIFHKLEKLSDISRRAAYYRRLRADGFFSLLWENASGFTQQRKIVKHYLKSLFLSRSPRA